MPAPAEPARKTAPAKSGRKWLWITLILVVFGGGGGGGFWWWQGQQAAAHAANKAAKPHRAPAQYYALEPAFVVNLVDTEAVRYLQADVQLVTRDADTRAAVEAHAPAIRNRLLLLFGQQSSAQLAQRSGKERLQAAALNEARQVLKQEGAADRVDAVIFTSLVTQ
ncbi:flagellar basal body-associated protein FliL [Lysobacter yangpyeongensis]|uniref:Flagellar protein FliL n=1 Tax=Lysobacter yangpyeongensis TaxID=346182 RepID=A0ABW0SIW4_9GAMM